MDEEEYRARINELRTQWLIMKDLNERLQAALLWIEDHDPQIVEAARTKFKLGKGAGQ